MRKLKVLLWIVAGALLGGCIKTPGNPNDLKPVPGMEKTFVVLPYGDGGAFWDKFREGAKHAAAEGGYKIQWETPPPVWTIKQQEEALQTITSLQPPGIILGPLHRNRVQGRVSEAAELGIPVVVAASNEDTTHQLTYVGSDNTALGKDLAQWVAQQTPDGGKIAVMKTQPGMRSVDMRLHELLGELDGKPLQQIAFPADRDLNYQAINLQKIMADTLQKYLQQNANVASVVAPDENSTVAAWNVLQKIPVAKRPRLFGVSVDPHLLKACNEGKIAVLVQQNPYKMGELSAASIIEFIYGRKPQQQIYVPYEIVHAAKPAEE